MEGIEWIALSEGDPLPENALEGGQDGDVQLYVGRAEMFDDVLPGKVIAGEGCVVSYGGAAHKSADCQVLVTSDGIVFDWESGSEGTYPENAVPGGNTADGETLYIGRAPFGDGIVVGKIHPSHACLYVANGEEESAITEYEVLVAKPADE